MTIEIRATAEREWRAAAGAMATALLGAPPSDEQWQRSLPSWHEMVSLSAWDGHRCVGHAGEFDVATSVPGGARLPTGAVSRVGVLPTDRRRGAATGLMERLIVDSAARGNVLMSLRASEAVIYDRYGFGVAGDDAQVTVTREGARPLSGAAGGSFRLLAPDEILDVIPPLYDRAAHRRPGVIERPTSWNPRLFRSAIEQSTGSYVAVHVGGDGTPDGYVHYDVTWSDGMAAGSVGTGMIHDLFGIDDSVEIAIWTYLLDIDLVTSWKAGERPVDDVVRCALHDPRAYAVTSIEDEQWLRLLDVDTALDARSYNAATVSIAIRVTDSLLGVNNGTWRIDASGARRSPDEPDLTVPVATLSAGYLGGTPWHALAASGAVDVHCSAAVSDADVLFGSRPLPFCGTFF